MTIATYSDLQTAVGNWLDHSLFAARVPDFITLFEAAANRRLRVRQQEAAASLTPGADGSVSIPADHDYLSEDYAFCRRWQAIGGKLHVDTRPDLSYQG